MHFFIRQFFSIDRPKINAWVALRNTIGLALCFAVFVLAGHPLYGLVAGLGALVVSYLDADDAYASRARRLSVSSVLFAFAVFAGSLAIQSYALAFSLAVAGAFLSGLVVALGSMITDLFLFSLVMFIIFATEPLPLEKSLIFALLTLLGGLLQTGLSILFWPIRRYEPERRELGKLYLELSRLLRAPLRSRTTPIGSAQINRAHQALSELRRDHGLEGDRYRSLLSQAERIRISLIYLLRRNRWLQRSAPRGEAPATRALSLFLTQFLEGASESLGFTAQILFTAEAAPRAKAVLKRLEQIIAEVSASPGVPPDTLAQMVALSGQLRAAMGLASRSVPAGTEAFAKREAARPWRLRFQGPLATLRANLTLKSTAFRHGIRMAAAIAVGEATAYFFRLERSYWIPMTIVLVLKPEFTSTLSRGLLRVLGTLGGLVVATILYRFLPHQTGVELPFIAGYMFLLRWVGAANYGIFTFMLSGLVVSLLAIAGSDPNQLIWARGLNTCIGGGIALLTYWAWPTWARNQVQETLAEMLDAYRRYFLAVSNGLKPAAEMDNARLASRLARSNQEASSAHMQAEPGTTEAQRRLLNAIQASSNRLAYNIMALEAGNMKTFTREEQPLFLEFAERVEQTLRLLSESLKRAAADAPNATPWPNVRESQIRLAQTHHNPDHQEHAHEHASASVYAEIDRITNSLNTLREQILQWLAKKPRG
jgi:uncharacterized membrane protein YccC